MAKIEPVCPPAALRKPQAAAHCGMGIGYFEQMVSEGIMPKPRAIGDGVKVWLRAELEEALLAAPTEGTASGPNPCDRLLNP